MPASKKTLKEIYNDRPLLFDFALQRTVRPTGIEKRFSTAAFQNNFLIIC